MNKTLYILPLCVFILLHTVKYKLHEARKFLTHSLSTENISPATGEFLNMANSQ